MPRTDTFTISLGAFEAPLDAEHMLTHAITSTRGTSLVTYEQNSVGSTTLRLLTVRTLHGYVH